MRSALALLLGVVALLTIAPSAVAVVDTEQIARALEESPVYVDPSFDDVVTAADREEIVAAVQRQDRPVYVALVPLRGGDRFDGDDRAFLSALASRVGDPRAVFVAFSEQFPTSTSDDTDTDLRLSRARAAMLGELGYDASVPDQLVTLLDAFADPDLDARYERAQEQSEREQEASESSYDDLGVPAWLVVGLVLVGLAIAAGAVVTRRRGGAAPGAPPLLPDRVFEHARAAAFDGLRDSTRAEVIRLSAAIEAAPTPSGGDALAAYERAVESAAAASALHDRATATVELAGVLVLVDGGREALREAADLAAGRRHTAARPLCFFDPLHGHSARDVRWAVRDVAACRACATAVKAGRDPDVLREDGVPWFERDGALAATGMGQFAGLAPRLARGDAP